VGGGLLVGIERERRKGTGAQRQPAGVRTFTVVALIGAVAALIGPTMIAVACTSIAALAAVSHWHSADRDPGLTTEICLVATFLLGALAVGAPTLAAALFVALAVLLQSKEFLHDFTKRVLGEQELDDALLLGASVLIVLPLLPDRPVDPWEVLNPRRLWLVAVLVMSINAAGYIALRALGGRYGLPLAGFFGGFVSSSATIAGMGQRAASDAKLRGGCIAAALLSCVATVVQIALICAAIEAAWLRALAVPLVATGAVAVVVALPFLRGARAVEASGESLRGRPFALRHALLFAGIVAVALLLSKFLQVRLGSGGVIAAAAATGFADVHAATVSLAQAMGAQAIDATGASRALAAAFTTNSIVKGVAAGTGGVAYARAVIPGIAAINLAFVLAVLLV
jgi:uncharacterized membrane protein (DUF4010 family)